MKKGKGGAKGRRGACGRPRRNRGRRLRRRGAVLPVRRLLSQARCWARWAAWEELDAMDWLLVWRARPFRGGAPLAPGCPGRRARPACPGRPAGRSAPRRPSCWFNLDFGSSWWDETEEAAPFSTPRGQGEPGSIH